MLRAAVDDQGLAPELADQPLRLVANGWDNMLFRLGPDLLVRLPRRELAVPLVEHEQRWLPELAPRLPLPVPAPVFAGRPLRRPEVEFPWPWSIVPWFEGEPLGLRPLARVEASTLARDLARFLHALHNPAPADAPLNPFRGGPLSGRADPTAKCLEPGSAAMVAVGSPQPAQRVRDRWHEALAQPDWSRPRCWLHGDLHPLNLVWRPAASTDPAGPDDPSPARGDEDGSPPIGRLVAVIDFGDITGGDPATDLAAAWWLFPDPDHRAEFRSQVRIGDSGVDDATWSRARGWALSVAATLVSRSADHPVLFELARRTLIAVARDRT
jgi:aminoglycoside phosphotransferase (APT) family kinase protein